MSCEFTCPHCSQVMECEDEWHGLQAVCPTCGKQTTLPAAPTALALVLPPLVQVSPAQPPSEPSPSPFVPPPPAQPPSEPSPSPFVPSPSVSSPPKRSNTLFNVISCICVLLAVAGSLFFFLRPSAGEQFNRGIDCYEDGNYAEAVKWFRKAAKRGHAMAQNNLGKCYNNGQGIEQDYAEAVKWFRKAAEQDLADAETILGLRYYNGEGVRQDYAEAVKWFRKAAEQDLAEAETLLGLSYYKGEGVRQDYAEAVGWFKKSAEQGDVFGQLMLGACYFDGTGVKMDNTKAVKWLRKAYHNPKADDNVKQIARETLIDMGEKL